MALPNYWPRLFSVSRDRARGRLPSDESLTVYLLAKRRLAAGLYRADSQEVATKIL